MSDVDWPMVRRLEDAAKRMSNAAQQIEDASNRVAQQLDPSWGGNGAKLVELLERQMVAETGLLPAAEPVIAQPQPRYKGRTSSPTTVISKEVYDFLHGQGKLEECWFGDRHPTRKGQCWWRAFL